MQEIVNGNPALRRTLYTVYALIGLALGSTQVAYSAAEAGQPVWLTVALAVFAYVGTAFGFGARAKVDATPTPVQGPGTLDEALRRQGMIRPED